MKMIYQMPWSLSVIGLFFVFILGGCESLSTVSASKNVQRSESAAIESDLVKSLQRQIKERDRRIEELTSQLESLKAIDQDFASRRKQSYPSGITTPIE
jgi:predicted RNase H-like nuclease (RuvC/YqgF family)